MRNFRNYIAILCLSLILISSCSKEEEAITLNNSEQELSSVSLVSGCEDETTGDIVFGFNVTAGTPKDLTKYRKPRRHLLPINPQTRSRYMKKDVVGMGIDGDANLCFVWYKNKRYSAGTSRFLDAIRGPDDHSYTLPRNPQTNAPYQPEDIVGMAIDGESNTVYTWYRNEYVSAGSPGDLGSKIDPRHYDLAVNPKTGNEFKPGHIKAIAIDGERNRTVVFYKYNFVSEGVTTDLDYFSAQGSGAYCIEKRPAININPKHFLGAGIDYTNRHVFMWSKVPDN